MRPPLEARTVTVDSTTVTTPIRPPTDLTAQRESCGNATFEIRPSIPTRLVIAVVGEIDAVNARALGRYIERHVRVSTQLVLDLRAVEFFGSQGFTALYFVSAHCARRDVDWVVAGSPAVARALSVCDPGGTVPLADDLTEALSRVDRLPPARQHATWSGAAGWRTLS